MDKQVPLKIGFIGCGRVAQMRHLPILRDMKGVQIAAIADIDSETLSAVARQYKVDRCYENHHDLLKDEMIDAVLVCTPPASHFQHARDVLESGRHLYTDSPLALTIEECEALEVLGEQSGKTATVGLNLRYHSLVQRAKRCIQDGWIGQVHAITATFSTPSRGMRGDKFPPWRQPNTIEGNVFGESALQHFDTWRALTSAEFTEISAHCADKEGPVSLSAVMQGNDAGKSYSIVVASTFSEYAGDNSEIRLIGREGTIALSLYRYDGFSYCPALVAHGSAGQHLRAVRESLISLPQGLRNLFNGGEYGITFKLQLEAFAEACRGGKAPLVSLADGRAAATASIVAFQSLNSEQKIKIQSGS
jgi:predicted dehydrogenase